MQSPPAYTLWPHDPALPARVALQDVGDERSRTESEFFQYVSQVSAGATQAGRAKCRALPSRPCLVSGIFFGGALWEPARALGWARAQCQACGYLARDQAGKREALAFGTPTIGHAKRPAPQPQVYRYFMTGDDAKCEEEDGKQAAEFEARAGGVKADTERLRAVGVPWACVPGQIGCQDWKRVACARETAARCAVQLHLRWSSSRGTWTSMSGQGVVTCVGQFKNWGQGQKHGPTLPVSCCLSEV